MKVSEIKQGMIYHDGKFGVRQVLSIANDNAGVPRVEYKILSAKVTQSYCYAEKSTVSIIGNTSSCELASFAVWAKSQVVQLGLKRLLASLNAQRIKLAPGELAFMDSICESLKNDLPAESGVEVSFVFNETRTANSVCKKGLGEARLSGNGQGGFIVLSELGAAWIQLHSRDGNMVPGKKRMAP